MSIFHKFHLLFWQLSSFYRWENCILKNLLEYDNPEVNWVATFVWDQVPRNEIFSSFYNVWWGFTIRNMWYSIMKGMGFGIRKPKLKSWLTLICCVTHRDYQMPQLLQIRCLIYNILLNKACNLATDRPSCFCEVIIINLFIEGKIRNSHFWHPSVHWIRISGIVV